MTTYFIRVFNDGDCELCVNPVEVPEGADATPYIKRELYVILVDYVPEPGDTIKITRD